LFDPFRRTAATAFILSQIDQNKSRKQPQMSQNPAVKCS
jgi:hypothetical protein